MTQRPMPPRFPTSIRFANAIKVGQDVETDYFHADKFLIELLDEAHPSQDILLVDRHSGSVCFTSSLNAIFQWPEKDHLHTQYRGVENEKAKLHKTSKETQTETQGQAGKPAQASTDKKGGANKGGKQTGNKEAAAKAAASL